MRLNERIAREIGIDKEYVNTIASRNNLYAKYYIDKKDGGKREILQPSKELKVIQRWLLRNIFKDFPVSPYSCAYSKGDSIKKNAMFHKDSRYILHTDIKNFFPSITREMVSDYFNNNENTRNLGIGQEDIDIILDICLYRGEYLVVGSVASPRIANMIMYDFDLQLKKELDCRGRYIYTRYADDIVISSNEYIESGIIDIIEKLMIDFKFTMNHRKTYFMNKKSKRQITGVVLDNNTNKLTIGNKQYKDFERTLYKYLVKNEGDENYINGYLAYIKEISIEQYTQIKNIYKRYDKQGRLFEKV